MRAGPPPRLSPADRHRKARKIGQDFRQTAGYACAMKNIPPTIRDELAGRFAMAGPELDMIGGGQDWSDGTVWLHAGLGLVLKVLDFPIVDIAATCRAEDRLALVAHLAGHGARIVRPLPSEAGRLFEETADAEKRYLAYCYRHVPGRPVRPSDPVVKNGAFCRALGAELGRLHRAWESHPAALRPDGTCDAGPALGGWREEMAFFRAWCREERVGRAWDRLRQALEGLPVDRRGYGFVHNDAHADNLIHDPASAAAHAGHEPEFTVIDFDVANFHWFMNDCAAALYSFRIASLGGIEPAGRQTPPGYETQYAAWFWEGYRRHREPGQDWLARVDLFLHYRRCLLFMPFQEQTAQHPAWRDNWITRIEEGDRALFG